MGQGGFEVDGLICEGVDKIECMGVEQLPCNAISLIGRHGPVYRISKNGCSAMFQMHSDLMGSTGYKLYFDERELAIIFQNLATTDRFLSTFFTNGHFFAVDRMAFNGGLDGTVSWVANADSEVVFFDFSLAK